MTSEWQRVGTHQFRVEDDSFTFKWNGALTGADMQLLLPMIDAMIAEHSSVFAIVDARNASGADAETRKTAAQWPNYQRIAGLAYIGASLTVRVVVKITLSARKLLGGALPGPAFFVDTEKEARACIDARRREISAQNPTDQA